MLEHVIVKYRSWIIWILFFMILSTTFFETMTAGILAIVLTILLLFSVVYKVVDQTDEE